MSNEGKVLSIRVLYSLKEPLVNYGMFQEIKKYIKQQARLCTWYEFFILDMNQLLRNI